MKNRFFRSFIISIATHFKTLEQNTNIPSLIKKQNIQVDVYTDLIKLKKRKIQKEEIRVKKPDEYLWIDLFIRFQEKESNCLKRLFNQPAFRFLRYQFGLWINLFSSQFCSY